MVKLAFDPADLPRLAEPRDIPAYTVPEAALALRIPVSTVRSWFFGHKDQFEPLLDPAMKDPRLLSFNNLIEVFVLRSLRTKHGLPMAEVRNAIARIEDELGISRPLLHESLKADGGQLFIELLGQTQRAATGQKALFTEHLERVGFESGVAARLYPFYWPEEVALSPRNIVIDYSRSFGRPIVDRIGIPTEVIHDRWWSGERIESLAKDFRCEIEDIDEALRYERFRDAA